MEMINALGRMCSRIYWLHGLMAVGLGIALHCLVSAAAFAGWEWAVRLLTVFVFVNCCGLVAMSFCKQIHRTVRVILLTCVIAYVSYIGVNVFMFCCGHIQD